jgi:hypothetical protein
MNVRTDAASENWEKLFSKIHEQRHEEGTRSMIVELTDSEAGHYDFANDILMLRMRASLVEALQRSAMWIKGLTFGSKFFMTMDEEQQRSFFHSIFRLPIWNISVGDDESGEWTSSQAITISTSALLETLPHLRRFGMYFILNNFALTRKSDVQTLWNIIGSKFATLRYLCLENIECPVDECNKQDSDGPDGFLDPLFHSPFGVDDFSVSTKMRSVHSTLVSPRVLRALFVEGERFRSLSLRSLGLTDNHVLAIVDGLSTRGTHL